MTNHNDITELIKLFDLTKMNIYAPRGEKMFKYGDYADEDIQSAIETLGEHQTIGNIISFGLAIANFEARYRAEHEDKEAFTSDYNQDGELIQVFLSMYSEWNKGYLNGEEDGYFYNYVYRKLAEMQELIDSDGGIICKHCGSVIDKDYVFYFKGEPCCSHCAQVIANKAINNN